MVEDDSELEGNELFSSVLYDEKRGCFHMVLAANILGGRWRWTASHSVSRSQMRLIHSKSYIKTLLILHRRSLTSNPVFSLITHSYGVLDPAFLSFLSFNCVMSLLDPYQLPYEILFAICSLLSPRDFLTLRMTTRGAAQLLDDSQLWRGIVRAFWPHIECDLTLHALLYIA